MCTYIKGLNGTLDGSQREMMSRKIKNVVNVNVLQILRVEGRKKSNYIENVICMPVKFPKTDGWQFATDKACQISVCLMT